MAGVASAGSTDGRGDAHPAGAASAAASANRDSGDVVISAAAVADRLGIEALRAEFSDAAMCGD